MSSIRHSLNDTRNGRRQTVNELSKVSFSTASERSMFPKNRLSRLVAVGLVLPLLTYIALSPPIAWPLYNSILFQPGHNLGSEEPWRQIEQEFNVKRKDVFFKSADGTKIHGWFFRLPNTTRTFVVSQGKGGSLYNRSGMARMLLRCGGSVLLYNYRGYGRSEGIPSLDGVCDDGCAAFDYLVEKEGGQSDRIIAYGESFGSGVTGQIALRRKVGAVIIQSGFSSLLRASRDVLPWLHLYPDSWFPAQTMDNIAVFRRPHAPLLIVHGRLDNFVVSKNADDLFAAAIEPKMLLVLPEGDHGSFGKGNEFFRTVEKFLRNHNL